jgi:hypothetical protein
MSDFKNGMAIEIAIDTVAVKHFRGDRQKACDWLFERIGAGELSANGVWEEGSGPERICLLPHWVRWIARFGEQTEPRPKDAPRGPIEAFPELDPNSWPDLCQLLASIDKGPITHSTGPAIDISRPIPRGVVMPEQGYVWFDRRQAKAEEERRAHSRQERGEEATKRPRPRRVMRDVIVDADQLKGLLSGVPAFRKPPCVTDREWGLFNDAMDRVPNFYKRNQISEAARLLDPRNPSRVRRSLTRVKAALKQSDQLG